MELKKGKYLTITEMAERLDISYLAAKQRLLRAGIKPIATDTLYEAVALESIRNVPGKGRPKKPETKTKTTTKKAAKSKE